jgi:hypothetical protein
VSLGLARERLLNDRRRDSDVGSLIGGGEGVLLEAGRDLAVIAAEITSPADIALIAGRDLGILPGSIVERHRRVESQSFAGITASVGTNVVGAAQRLGDAVAVFGSGHGDARYEALGMVSGVLQGVDAVRDLSNPGISASLSIGASSSRFEQQSRFDGVIPARIDAGGDLLMAAGRDLAVAALQARAGGDLDLYAGRDLAIESALATQSQSMRHSATSAALGLDLGWSIAGGQSMGISLSANHARGNQSGTAASHVDSNLLAGERLSLLTGNDALIAGAQLRGRDVLLDIGGDLHVASRADTARLRGSSFNAGIGLTIGLMPGAGSSLDLSLGGGRERADSSLINQQTAIIADERLGAYVEGHTQLDGGLIASLNGDLSLDTGTFGFSDIDERARSDMRRATVSLGLGGGGSPSLGVEGELAHTATDAVTRATIGEGEITIRDADAQRAREEAGETRDVAALNRDLDMARETLRDERAGVRFYASDSSVRELASGFAQTRANLEALANLDADQILEDITEIRDLLREVMGSILNHADVSQTDSEKALALMGELADGRVSPAELAACGPGRQGFNLHDLIFGRAYASDVCQRYSQHIIDLCLDGLNATRIFIIENAGAFAETLGDAAERDPVAHHQFVELLSWLDPRSKALEPFEEEFTRAIEATGLNPGEYIDAFITGQMNAFVTGDTTPEMAIMTSVSAVYIALRIAPAHLRSEITQSASHALRRTGLGSLGAFYEPRRWRQHYDDFYAGRVTSTTVPPYSKPNVRLAGQRHPETGVVFDQRGFPIFDDIAIYDTRFASDAFRNASYQRQMRMATIDLRQQIQNNPQLANQFSVEQRAAIQRGSRNIPELTWHHHQDTGRMQLVPREEHIFTGHVGGGAIASGR